MENVILKTKYSIDEFKNPQCGFVMNEYLSRYQMNTIKAILLIYFEQVVDVFEMGKINDIGYMEYHLKNKVRIGNEWHSKCSLTLCGDLIFFGKKSKYVYVFNKNIKRLITVSNLEICD